MHIRWPTVLLVSQRLEWPWLILVRLRYTRGLLLGRTGRLAKQAQYIIRWPTVLLVSQRLEWPWLVLVRLRYTRGLLLGRTGRLAWLVLARSFVLA